MKTPKTLIETPVKIIHIKPITTFTDCQNEANTFIQANKLMVEKRLAELKISQPIWDVGYGLWLTEATNPYDEIMNLIRQHQCSILDMWSVFFENVALKGELARLKEVEIVDVNCGEI